MSLIPVPTDTVMPGYPVPVNTPRLPPGTIMPELWNKNVLCILDYDNLRLSVLEAERRFSARLLFERLHAACGALEPWAVLAAPAPTFWRVGYLQEREWNVLPMVWENTSQGVLRNADFDIVALAAERVATKQFDAIIVGSGDGSLVLAIARSVQRAAPSMNVFTLSARHSTSSRILSANTDLVAANIFLGEDLVRSREREKHWIAA